MRLTGFIQLTGHKVMWYNECQYLTVTDATARCNFVKWNTRYAPNNWAGMNSGGTLMSIIDHSGHKMTLGQLMPPTTYVLPWQYHQQQQQQYHLIDIFICSLFLAYSGIVLIGYKYNKKSSSGDRIANVNFLYDDIVHTVTVQNTIDSCIGLNSATDRRGYVLEHRFTKFSERFT